MLSPPGVDVGGWYGAGAEDDAESGIGGRAYPASCICAKVVGGALAGSGVAVVVGWRAPAESSGVDCAGWFGE